MQSMTGFGAKEIEISGVGKVNVELRSVNHKFLESVIRLPDGLIALEDRVSRKIESRIKRGRVICNITLPAHGFNVSVNKALLKSYLATFKQIKREFKMHDEISMNTLIHLPGVLSAQDNKKPAQSIWKHLEPALNVALDNLAKTRDKEGLALSRYLKNKQAYLERSIRAIKMRFKKGIARKLATLVTDEERANFLRESDITEELERLTFHISNFKHKMAKSGPIGKELDFIAQEMQREANTLAAKSFDVAISSRIVEIKSNIEKIREQAQNIE
jgi:uncharacterized protein (TIGR00255 family)